MSNQKNLKSKSKALVSGLCFFAFLMSQVTYAAFLGGEIKGYSFKTCLQKCCVILKSEKAYLGKIFKGYAFDQATLKIESLSGEALKSINSNDVVYDLDLNRIFMRDLIAGIDAEELVFSFDTETMEEFKW